MLWLHYAMFMCAASDSIRRPDFTAPKFKCGISWHFSAWMWAKTQEFGFNAVDTCWAIDIWNPFHPFSIHFPCRYFRTICAFSIFFTCFQWFSVIVTCCQKSKNATAVGMIQLSARTQASWVRDYIFERCLAVPFPCCDSACLSPLNHR